LLLGLDVNEDIVYGDDGRWLVGSKMLPCKRTQKTTNYYLLCHVQPENTIFRGVVIHSKEIIGSNIISRRGIVYK